MGVEYWEYGDKVASIFKKKNTQKTVIMIQDLERAKHRYQNSEDSHLFGMEPLGDGKLHSVGRNSAPALKAAQARSRGKRWLKRMVYRAWGYRRARTTVKFGLSCPETRSVLKNPSEDRAVWYKDALRNHVRTR